MIAKNFLTSEIEKVNTVLNLGSGKIDEWMLPSKKQLMLNVDGSYPDCCNNNEETEILKIHEKTMLDGICAEPHMFNVESDIFEFIDAYMYKFDLIIANRILEHMFYDSGEIGRLLSGCHSLMADGGKMILIVPDHQKIFDMAIKWKPKTFEEAMRNALIINTECCNTRSDPHGSIWTPELTRMYIEQEGIFNIQQATNDVVWDDRDCYMIIELTKKNDK